MSRFRSSARRRLLTKPSSGTNVLAVHALNENIGTSSDFGFNAQLYTYIPDVTTVAPRVAHASPSPGEVLALRWDDLNTQWQSMTIRDKVEGERVIPLTPYVARMLGALPRSRTSDLAWALAGLGVASEMAQALVGREMSLHDFAGDMAGVALLVGPTWLAQFRRLVHLHLFHPPQRVHLDQVGRRRVAAE